MAKNWYPLSPGLPHLQDVGATPDDEAPLDGRLEPPWFVGTDGSFWKYDLSASKAEQVPSPGELSRIAVSPDGSKWCADRFGVLWRFDNSSWVKVDVPGEKVIDVAVSADRTVWIVMANGRYYSISNGGAPYYHGVWIYLDAISGVQGPNAVHPFGVAWGTSPMYGPSALCCCPSTVEGWNGTNVKNVKDLSVSKDGMVWTVKEDGTIWTTSDGAIQLRSDVVGGYRRVSAGVVNEYAVASDGSAWIRMEAPKEPPRTQAPPPPAQSPHPQGSGPTITVTTTGGAASTVFKVGGSGFLGSVQVTIRGARIDAGQIIHVYWLTNSDSAGKIQYDIPLPCVPGLGISFSANDGRPNPADLTGKLWSNTVTVACPLG